MSVEEPKPTPDASRRHWLRLLSFGEVLGIVGLAISALALWNNFDERRSGEEEKARSEQQAARKTQALVLKGTVDVKGQSMTLAGLNDQVIQSQTIRFPSALGINPVDSSSPRIEASWFDSQLKRAIRDEKAKATTGDARIPVVISTRFYTDGRIVQDVALYDVGYGIKDGGWLSGSEVQLKGLSFIARAPASAAAARVDALWKARHPAS